LGGFFGLVAAHVCDNLVSHTKNKGHRETGKKSTKNSHTHTQKMLNEMKGRAFV